MNRNSTNRNITRKPLLQYIEQHQPLIYMFFFLVEVKIERLWNSLAGILN